MWGNTIMVLFLLSVQVLWAKLVRKQVDLSTNMMWPLMFVCLQCSHKPKSSIPRWVYPIASLQFQLSQPLDFLSNFNQSTEGMKFWSCFFFFFVKQQVTETIDVCVEDETVNYLNRKDVQSAMHAHLVGVQRWSACSK